MNVQQLRADYIFNNLVRHFSFKPIGLNFFAIFLFTLALAIIVAFVVGLRLFFLFRKQLKEKPVFLELTPPSRTEQDAYTTEKLFSLIHALTNKRTLIDRLLGNKTRVSLEIVSTKNQGIRYLLRTTKSQSNTLRRSLLSYLPQLTVKADEDYLPESIGELKNRKFEVVEFKLSHHFAFPLNKQVDLAKHDPIAYITGMMTKLDPTELISLQILLATARPAETKKISNIIFYNGDVLDHLSSKNIPSYLKVPALLLKSILSAVFSVFMLPFWVISTLATNQMTPVPHLLGSKPKSDRIRTSFENELVEAINSKINQPLFEATIRVLIVVKNSQNLGERVSGFASSFATFANHGHQSIIVKKNPSFIKDLLYQSFKKRIFGLSTKSHISVSEASDIYHFPFTKITKTEDIVKVHSRQLPAPIALKRAENLDITFAINKFAESSTEIGLNEEERRRHMYILGATGTGKSTLLLSMINQDIENGKGLCVIDPHGDLVEKILPTIPENRLKDIIYFNPDDVEYPIGINLLELTPGLSDEESLREKEFITESIISLFHKLYSEKYSGPRMEYILRNTIHTAFTVPNATLFTVYKLLINTKYRERVTDQLTDENLKDFWEYEFSKAGDYQKVKMISPITNKIGRFLFSATAKRILEQEKSSINFDEIMDNGKILLCNLSKGRIGEDTSEVFGILVMTKIQLAALKRARVDISKRRDFYLYVDEFQNFATPAFAQILSEARKYRLSAILAHQTVSQIQDKDLVNVTLANTGTIICFRTANPEDERMILPQFIPYIQQGEIASLPSFNFYMKISALNPEEPFSGQTIAVESVQNDEKVDEVVRLSREHYASKYVQPTVVMLPKVKVSTESVVSTASSVEPLP
ncbi:MAG: DUF87 domain-containing protein [Candidatus Woykebacteria bacterium]